MFASRRGIIALCAALVLSLGLNLFLGGLLAGRFAPRPPAGHEWSSLPDADRAAVKTAMKGLFDSLRPQLGELPQIKRELRESLAAEPFDPARFNAAVTRLGEVQAAIRAKTAETVAATAPKLSKEARGGFARVLMKMTSIGDERRPYRPRGHDKGSSDRGSPDRGPSDSDPAPAPAPAP